MKMRPLQDRIVVKRSEGEETDSSAIIIPDTVKEKPLIGTVMAVGNGKILDNGTRVEVEVRVGDKIMFGKYAANEIKIEGEEYLIMCEDDLFGVIEED